MSDPHYTPENSTSLHMSETFKKALRMMDGSRKNLFITGKAGTGKSTLLQYFRDHTTKQMAILAPTGVAAVNIKGQTIHSFFKFRPDVTNSTIRKIRTSKGKKNIYQRLDMLIIDEISMVRADLLDCIDAFLRLNGPDMDKPFGGIQVIFFGDLYQLPPVISRQSWKAFENTYDSPYFFSATVMKDADMEITLVELDKIYRQKDNNFIEILNAIRTDTVSKEQLVRLNERYQPESDFDESDLTVYLTPTNKAADALNEKCLGRIDKKYRLFDGEKKGEFKEGHLPAPLELKIKIGAQIMLLNNDPKQRWINGTMAKVLRIAENHDHETYIRVELDNGKRVNITPYTWEMYKYILDEEKIQSETVGSFTQYPLKLAWGMTIHKSQGKTFEHAVIDLGHQVFSAGQTYVALSRCTSLDGLVLRHPITSRHIKTDQRVTSYIFKSLKDQANKVHSVNDKMYSLAQAIEEGSEIKIMYLRKNGTQSERLIDPLDISEMSFRGKKYQGLKAYCHTAHKEMIFDIEQILTL